MTSLLLLFAVGLVSAADDMSGGLCIEAEYLLPVCLAGSTMEYKLQDAMWNCYGNFSSEGFVSARASSCPSADEMIQELQADFAEEGCWLYTWGWMDDNMTANHENIDADLMTLYPEISGQISEEVIGQCAGDYWKGRKNRRMRKCIKKMEAEDQQLIWEMLDNIAAFRCFQQEFNNACTNYVNDYYIQPMLSSFMMGSGSGFTGSGSGFTGTGSGWGSGSGFTGTGSGWGSGSGFTGTGSGWGSGSGFTGTGSGWGSGSGFTGTGSGWGSGSGFTGTGSGWGSGTEFARTGSGWGSGSGFTGTGSGWGSGSGFTGTGSGWGSGFAGTGSGWGSEFTGTGSGFTGTGSGWGSGSGFTSTGSGFTGTGSGFTGTGSGWGSGSGFAYTR